jgi:hypothetical protein
LIKNNQKQSKTNNLVFYRTAYVELILINTNLRITAINTSGACAVHAVHEGKAGARPCHAAYS